MDERRGALAEGQRRRRVGDRQEAPVALHEPRPGRARGRRPRQSSTGIQRDVGAVGQQRGEGRPGLGQGRDLGADGRAVLEARRSAASSSAVGQRHADADRRHEREPAPRGRRADRRRRSPAPAPAASPAHVEPTPRAIGQRGRRGPRCSWPRRRRPDRRAAPSRAARHRSRPGWSRRRSSRTGCRRAPRSGRPRASIAPSAVARGGRQQLDRQAEAPRRPPARGRRRR